MRLEIPIVSLFCGCGGMDYGLKQKGFVPIVAIDNSEITIQTYNENNVPHVAVKSDISKLSGKKIISMIDGLGNGIKPRGIVGGPPCQPFSISNVYHNPEDPRNFLPLKFASIMKAVNKKYKLDFFVFENVIGLNSKKHANVFESIKKSFTDAGFNLFIGELNAKYFGVAQSRKRLFVVGINKDLYPNIEFKFPKGNKGCIHTVRDVIGGLPEPIFFSRSLSAGDIPFHQNHWTMNPKSPKFSNNLDNENSANGRSFRKLDWDKPSDTLAFGHREINVHPNGHRRISIFEAMRIQGFPDNYKIVGNLTQQVYQVSDALPPNVALAIGESIREAIYLPQTRITKKLINWYKENHRDYPWRNTNDPYSILIAEKLLQQTAAIDKLVEVYNRIINTYPTPWLLAHADISDLEDIIQPLGLRYRAKELRDMANELTARYNGEVPRDLKKLIELPGIGDYTARAVLSLAFGEDMPVVDTNIARFLYRMFGLKGGLPSNPARKKALNELAGKIIPKGRARKFNLALLDLCAKICKPNKPQCLECPVQMHCAYYRGHNN